MHPLTHITNNVEIPTFYLINSLIAILCLFWISARAEKQKLSRKVCLDLSLIIMISGFIGARAMHVLYENFYYYAEHPLRIFYFWEGGFVFYGGAILATMVGVIYLYSKVNDLTLVYLDLFSPVLSLSYALGRLACLMGGCCYGRYCDLPWAIQGRHPAQAYASIWEFGVCLILLKLESLPKNFFKRFAVSSPGNRFYFWLILHSLGRLVMESYRDDFRGPNYLGLSISSWISIFLIIICPLLIWLNKSPTVSD